MRGRRRRPRRRRCHSRLTRALRRPPQLLDHLSDDHPLASPASPSSLRSPATAGPQAPLFRPPPFDPSPLPLNFIVRSLALPSHRRWDADLVLSVLELHPQICGSLPVQVLQTLGAFEPGHELHRPDRDRHVEGRPRRPEEISWTKWVVVAEDEVDDLFGEAIEGAGWVVGCGCGGGVVLFFLLTLLILFVSCRA
ncbi:uncharacterized protein J3R85_009530 [Psidium guajava]|nr:uncharacterized protein J3R85_009530 [Psidium guajava]